MDNRTVELRRDARLKIVAWAISIVELDKSREADSDVLYGWELEDRAAALLAELEPVIAEYAPPPGRILRALKYGNRADSHSREVRGLA